MVIQVYRQVVRDEISADRASKLQVPILASTPNFNPICPLWTICVITFCLSAVFDFPSGIWGVLVDLSIVEIGRSFSAHCNS